MLSSSMIIFAVLEVEHFTLIYHLPCNRLEMIYGLVSFDVSIVNSMTNTWYLYVQTALGIRITVTLTCVCTCKDNSLKVEWK